MRLQFLGATGTVTGSKYLVEHDGRRLLVDCGLFQGLKQLRLRNWAPLPVPPASIDAVLLTHAHIDHSGFIPRLVELGFRGKVFATPASVELCRLLLPDAGHLQEEEARYANRHGFPGTRRRCRCTPRSRRGARCGASRRATSTRPSSRCPASRCACSVPATSSARPARISPAARARCCSRATSAAATTW